MNENTKRRLARVVDALALAAGLALVALACLAVYRGSTVPRDCTPLYNTVENPAADDMAMPRYYQAAMFSDHPKFTRLALEEHICLNAFTLLIAVPLLIFFRCAALAAIG